MSPESQKKYHIFEPVGPPERDFPVSFPEEGTVYDYEFVKEGLGRWELWSKKLSEMPPLPKARALPLAA